MSRKSKPKPSAKADWKRFEELIGRLETMLGSENIRVKLNDQIPDDTGGTRQIDASVRVNLGTTEFLYIIECRQRSKGSDVTWVEQVASKRQKVGAVKAILVSNKKLSSNALARAKKENIDVRTLGEIDPAIFSPKMRPWMRMSKINWSPKVDMELRYADPQQLPMADFERIKSLAQAGSQEIKFLLSYDPEPKTIEEIISDVRHDLKYKGFGPEAKAGTALARMVQPGNPVYLVYEGRMVGISVLDLTFFGRVEEIPTTHDFSGHYQHLEGSLDHIVSESAFMHDGEEIVFTSAAQSNQKRFVVNIPYGFGNEEVRATMDKEKGASIEITFDAEGKPQMKRLA